MTAAEIPPPHKVDEVRTKPVNTSPLLGGEALSYMVKDGITAQAMNLNKGYYPELHLQFWHTLPALC